MTQTILTLLIALRAVESTNGLDPMANGNDYQITRVCVQDVNRIYGTRYRWPRDVRDRETAENIVFLYLSYYGCLYKKDTGRVPTKEVLAKIYHCGYDGFKNNQDKGNRYWSKIKRLKSK